MSLKLGKLPYTEDHRDLLLTNYLDLGALPKIPTSIGHEDKMPLPRLMLGNGPDDSVAPGFGGAGDCVLAWIANTIRLAHGIAGTPQPKISGKEAIAAYSELTGYVIGDDSTDQGTEMRAALNWWKKTGFKDGAGKRHKIAAFAAIPLNSKDLTKIWQSLYLLDVGVGLGIEFPGSAMDQFNANKPWTVVKGASIEGGHAIALDAKRPSDPKVETWARDQMVAGSFLEKYVDEAWVVFSEEALVRGKSLEGFNATQLLADLKAIGS